MIIPYKDINPTERFPFLTIGLIAVNIAIFLFQIFSDYGYQQITNQFAFIPYELHHGNLPHSTFISPFTSLVTYMFLHANLKHIGFNMLFLWIFGNNIEDEMHRIGFIIFYLLCGIISALVFELFHPETKSPLVGASGAISAILGAYLFLYPKAKLRVLILVFPVTVPAVIFLVLWFVLQISGFLQGSGNVAWIAHISGFVAGAILYRIFLRKR